jgi:hypothetical protein
MKSFMILGAIVGFLIGAGFSLLQNCPWSTALWRACIGALAAGILVRWWSLIWLQGLQAAVEHRRHARPSTPSPVKNKTAVKI